MNCAICGEPATCIGQYENMTTPEPACDECCVHTCEDGSCEPIEGHRTRSAEAAMATRKGDR